MLLTLLVLVGLSLLARPAPEPARAAVRQAAAGTTVSGDIAADTVWTKAAGPYDAGAVTVLPGATLTVEPGVEVRFAQNTGLTVRGALVARGTADDPVRFTGASAAPGAWRGISFIGTAAAPIAGSVLEHAVVEYGGLPFTAGANLYAIHAEVALRDSVVRSGPRAGVYAEAGGVVHIADTAITGNAGEAVVFTDGSANPTLARIAATGNGSDTIGLGGGLLRGEHVWEAAGPPYHPLPGNTLLSVERGASLTIEPGVAVRFDNNARLRVAGMLRAEGSAERPITLTAATPEPGFWQGLLVEGAAEAPAAAVLSHVVVEYGGVKTSGGANITVAHAQLLMSRSVVRGGPANGIVLGQSGHGSAIQTTQIAPHPGYSMINVEPDHPALAANNWWGAASGPLAESGCAAGAGGKVSRGVVVSPFLAAPDAEPAAVRAAEARLIALTPRRWFAPADGATPVWVEITLTDGAGAPLAGRTVRLQTSRGTVVDGGVTDVRGHTFASLTSVATGDAVLTALLDLAASCEFTRSGSATVTFTQPAAEDELLPGAAAPYVSGRIKAGPRPLTRGVPATLSAEVTNPGTAPIVVEGTFSYAQQGIGLAFGPLGQPQQLVIPPGATVTFSTPFTPPIEGHYCFRFTYTVAAGRAGLAADKAAGGSAQENFDFQPPPLPPLKNYDDVRREQQDTAAQPRNRNFFDRLLHFWPDLIYDAGQVGDRYNRENRSRQGGKALPTPADAHGFRALYVARTLALPQVAPGQVSAARAAAQNAVTSGLAGVLVNFEAAAVASERYHAAADARDLQWASLQASAAAYYGRAAGQSLVAAADAIDAYLQVLAAEGVAETAVTRDEVLAYQARVRAQGFTAEEAAQMRQIGMDEAAIAAYRQEVADIDPQRVQGDLLARLGRLAAAYRALGREMLANPLFGGAEAKSDAPGGSLARAGALSRTIQIGNPFGARTTIDLRVRPIDLPPDWIVAVTPASLALDPGEQRPVTITIVPGTAVQGRVAQMAVEGYAGAQLVDGVALAVPVPRQEPFDGSIHVFMPLATR